MKDYKINIKLMLKAKFLQSGKNKKEIEKKVNDVIINSIKSDKVLYSLFFDEFNPKLKIKIKRIRK